MNTPHRVYCETVYCNPNATSYLSSDGLPNTFLTYDQDALRRSFQIIQVSDIFWTHWIPSRTPKDQPTDDITQPIT